MRACGYTLNSKDSIVLVDEKDFESRLETANEEDELSLSSASDARYFSGFLFAFDEEDENE
jgi:hypothetical protein